MRKLLLVALLTAAPLFSMPAAAFACDWFGYGYSSAYTPSAYSYAPTRRYYRSEAYYGGALYRPLPPRCSACVRLPCGLAWRASVAPSA